MDLFEFNEKISDSSKKLYTHNLKKLNDGNNIKNLNFLKKINVIEEKLSKLTPNTRRTYLIAIVSVLKNRDKLNKIKEIYYEKMMKLNKELHDNTDKTTKEENNWLNQDEINEKFNDLYKIVDNLGNKRKLKEGQYDKLLDCLILGLYTTMPPRRNLDYVKMVIGENSDNKDLNYYHNGKMYFNRYKTSKTYNQQTADVPEKLTKIIKLYLKFKPKDSNWFLINNKGKNIDTSVSMTRRLQNIFGRKISSSMLRKIYLTDKYSDSVKGLKEDASKMGTSVSTINNNYIKKDE
jgi:hypothetical protein